MSVEKIMRRTYIFQEISSEDDSTVPPFSWHEPFLFSSNSFTFFLCSFNIWNFPRIFTCFLSCLPNSYLTFLFSLHSCTVFLFSLNISPFPRIFTYLFFLFNLITIKLSSLHCIPLLSLFCSVVSFNLVRVFLLWACSNYLYL